MNKKLIDIIDVKKDYVTDEVVTPVLRGVTFSVAEGEFVAIMGPSGSGKSTLMHILGFLDRLTSGQYIFEGADTTTFDDNTLARLRNEKIGFVFQSFNLLPRTSVMDNVMLPMVYSRLNNKEMTARALRAIEAVGLAHRADHLSNQLSGGEQQRVAIARALVNDPRIIFADEPTGNLDSKSGGQIMNILQRLNDEGKTIILVTHEQNTADHAQRIIMVRDGVIVSDQKVTARQIGGGELRK